MAVARRRSVRARRRCYCLVWRTTRSRHPQSSCHSHPSALRDGAQNCCAEPSGCRCPSFAFEGRPLPSRGKLIPPERSETERNGSTSEIARAALDTYTRLGAQRLTNSEARSRDHQPRRHVFRPPWRHVVQWEFSSDSIDVLCLVDLLRHCAPQSMIKYVQHHRELALKAKRKSKCDPKR